MNPAISMGLATTLPRPQHERPRRERRAAPRRSAPAVGVTGCASLGLDDGYGSVTRDQIGELIGKVSDEAMGKAEAIVLSMAKLLSHGHGHVLSCTGWPTFGSIRILQRRLGRPVISSNLAMAWHARGTRES